MNLELDNRNYFILPVFLSLILVLIVTLSSNYPLSWDVYMHISYAISYLNNGLAGMDYLLNAPAGKVINHPPLYHLVLGMFSFFTGSNFVQAARLSQVVLTLCNVLTVSYVASKFFDERVGFFAGIILVSSFIFTRFFLPIPETLAMIFFTLAVYTYYAATIKSDYKYSLLTAVLSILTLTTHFSSFVYLMLLLFSLMIVQTIILRNFNAIEYYVYTVVPIFFIGIFLLMMLFMIKASYLAEILSGMISIFNNPFDLLIGQIAMGFERYVKTIGIVPLILAIVGLFYSFKKRELLFVSIWGLIAFVVSNLHWFGVPVYTFRLLIYLIIPMVIIGAYGMVNIIDQCKSKKHNIGLILTVALIIISFSLGLVHITDSSISDYKANTDQSTYQIAPPTSEEQDVIKYFENENVENKSILSNNMFFATVISSVDEVPLHYAFDVYTNKSLTKSSSTSLHDEQIGYIVYDKSLVMKNSSDYSTLDVKYIEGGFYPSYYFTKDIDENNFYTIKLGSTEKTFENSRFIVCKVI